MDETERKRRGPLTWLVGRSWRFWIGMALAPPVLYVLSLPLIPWYFAHGLIPAGSRRDAIVRGYGLPANLVLSNCPDPIPEWVGWYVGILLD